MNELVLKAKEWYDTLDGDEKVTVFEWCLIEAYKRKAKSIKKN